MNQERIAQLQKFIKDDPKDAFSKYALALEWLETDKQKSWELFEELLTLHPDYLSTYYHAAALLGEMGDSLRAEAIYQKGIELAEIQNASHALKELRSAYLNFQFEND